MNFLASGWLEFIIVLNYSIQSKWATYIGFVNVLKYGASHASITCRNVTKCRKALTFPDHFPGWSISTKAVEVLVH